MSDSPCVPSGSLRLTVGLTISPFALPVTLQARPTTPLHPLAMVEASTAAVQVGNATIFRIAGLIGIERDLLLGLLFLQDVWSAPKGLTSPIRGMTTSPPSRMASPRPGPRTASLC